MNDLGVLPEQTSNCHVFLAFEDFRLGVFIRESSSYEDPSSEGISVGFITMCLRIPPDHVDMHYLDAFERAVDCYSDKTALVTDDGEEVTYAELDRRGEALAATLDEHIPGERIATLTLNGEPATVAMVASLKRGHANVQLAFRNSPADLASMIETGKAAGLLFDEANAETAAKVHAQLDLDLVIATGDDAGINGALSYQEVRQAAPDREVTQADDAEFGIFFTSGTVGESKGVLFDQEQMWLGSTQVIMEMSLTETDVALMCAPWYHMFGTDAWVLPHLQTGATLVMQPEFDPVDALAKIEQYDVTGVPAVPTQLNAMLDVLEDESYDVSSLKKIRTGGAVVPVTLIERVKEHLTEGVFNTYGCTEAGPNMTFAHPSLQEDHPGTIGKESYMWEMRVVEPAPPTEDPDPAAEVEPGESGEIMVRGPGMGTGYLGNPDVKSNLIVDGWLRTKDVASLDEDGFPVVIDRVDNMLNSGGENIYPQEVERVLERHPKVDDVGVVGLPDDHWGHRIAAVISASNDIDTDDLESYCIESDQLADFKRPREYVITAEALPRTETGTLQRAKLHEYFDV